MQLYSNFMVGELERDIKNDPFLIDKPITLFYDYIPNNINQLKENTF